MATQKEIREREAQLAVEGAIDAILSVIELTKAPDDRYRETMKKLREDEYRYQN